MNDERLHGPPGTGEPAPGRPPPDDPGASPQAVAGEGTPAVPVAAGYGEDLLAVDDNQANLVAIEAALAPLGRKVVATRSGVEALAALPRQDFALILLDVQMPGMDGTRRGRRRRSSEAAPLLAHLCGAARNRLARLDDGGVRVADPRRRSARENAGSSTEKWWPREAAPSSAIPHGMLGALHLRHAY